jgi:integrase/recombinase XerC
LAGLTDPFLSAALGAALTQWLQQLQALEGAAQNTVEAYRRDVSRYLKFLSVHRGGAEGIAQVATTTQSDLRAWMAEERGRGLSARSLARALSAVKGFTAWIADRTGADATTVLSARGPKYRRKLPRPLSEDSAAEILTEIGSDAREDWIAARDCHASVRPWPADQRSLVTDRGRPPPAADLADHRQRRQDPARPGAPRRCAGR